MTTTTRIIQTDGSNGYQSGTYEWRIEANGCMWFDGGYSSRSHAAAEMRRRLRELKKAGVI